MNKRLGEILIEKGYLNEDQVQFALGIQQDESKEGMWNYIGQILVNQGIVTKDQVEEGLALLKKIKDHEEKEEETKDDLEK